jgi:hypothetical protein
VLLDFPCDGGAHSTFDAGEEARAHPFERMVRADLFGECEDVISHGFLIDEHNDCGAVSLRDEVAQDGEPPGDRVAGLGCRALFAFIFQSDHQLGHGERMNAGGLPVIIFAHQ